jgi:fructoselysine-6-P-deglycase FrlB-like protein
MGKLETKTMEPPKLTEEASKIVKASEDLISKTVPVLDKSTHGWWRLILMLMAAGSVISAVAIATKFDPNIPRPTGMKKAADDCEVKDGQFVDKTGDCW